MAQVKISEFATGSSLAGTELLETVQGGVNRKITIDQVAARSYVRNGTPSAPAFNATLNFDCSSVSLFDVSLTGNTTINFTNPAYDGQVVRLRLKQDATGGRTVTLGNSVRFGAEVSSYTATTTPNKTDILGFIYNATDAKFDIVAVAKGY